MKKPIKETKVFKIAADILSSVNIPIISAMARNIRENTESHPAGVPNPYKLISSVVFGAISFYLIAKGILTIDTVKEILGLIS